MSEIIVVKVFKGKEEETLCEEFSQCLLQTPPFLWTTSQQLFRTLSFIRQRLLILQLFKLSRVDVKSGGERALFATGQLCFTPNPCCVCQCVVWACSHNESEIKQAEQIVHRIHTFRNTSTLLVWAKCKLQMESTISAWTGQRSRVLKSYPQLSSQQ